MKIEIRFRNTEARSITHYLRKRYNSGAELPKLAKQAIRDIAAQEAKKFLEAHHDR